MCLYLVGPPEDALRLRLRLSSVPGRTRPSFGVAYAPRLVIIGRTSAWVGALANIVYNIRRGSSSPPSGRPGRSLTTETDLPQLLRLGMGGPRAYSIFHPNYGFVPVVATPVLDRHGGDSGEANGRNFRRRRSSLPSVSSLTAVVSS